jgi:hypothetical protein
MHPLLLPHVWSIFGRARMQLCDMVELSLSHRHVCKTVGRENTQSGTGDVHWTCDLDSEGGIACCRTAQQQQWYRSAGRQAGRLRERCSGHGRPAVAASQWSVTVMHAGAVHGARLRAAAVIVCQCRTSAAHTTTGSRCMPSLTSCFPARSSRELWSSVRQVHQGCCKSLTPCQEGSRDNPSLPPSTSTRWLSVWT